MTLVGVSQRVDINLERGERRDGLDQAWPAFLEACGFVAVPLPNRPELARRLLRHVAIEGVVLTGGNDLAAYGGDAPERDETERVLIEEADARGLPVIGVCRGMQFLQHSYGVRLSRVDGHVASRQVVVLNGESIEVNSYHGWGTRETAPGLDVLGRAEDGVVEAVRDASKCRFGMMWHPERFREPAARDIALFRQWFGSRKGRACVA